MSVLPGMRDFSRDHAGHKPYTPKDRGGQTSVARNRFEQQQQQQQQLRESAAVEELKKTEGARHIVLYIRCLSTSRGPEKEFLTLKGLKHKT